MNKQLSQDNPNGPAQHLVPANQREEYNWQGTVLDVRDPVEAAISDIVLVYRHRKASLLVDGDPFATFEMSARNLDIPYFGVPEALLHLIQQEQANINAMRRSGTLFNPQNPDALGSYLELAFYASLLYGWIKRYTQGYR